MSFPFNFKLSSPLLARYSSRMFGVSLIGSAEKFRHVLNCSSQSLELGTSRNYSRTVSGITWSALKYEQATIYYYNSSLERFIESENWSEAFNTVRHMCDAGLQPDIWKLSLEMKERCFSKLLWKEFTTLLPHLRTNGHFLTEIEVFSFAMSSCLKLNFPELVIELFQEMRLLSLIRPWAYIDAIHACKLLSDSSSAIEYLHEAVGSSQLSDNEYCDLHRLTLESCAEGYRWETIIKILDSMDDCEGRRDLACYRIGLQAAEALQDESLVHNLMREILEFNLSPDDQCYLYTIRCLSNLGNTKSSRDYFVDLANRRSLYSFKSKSWVCTSITTLLGCFECVFASALKAQEYALASDLISEMQILLDQHKNDVDAKFVSLHAVVCRICDEHDVWYDSMNQTFYDREKVTRWPRKQYHSV